ncbi:MAG TPA: hypothetical protein VFB67_10220 [Candidatus Polarisedimenticolaceae bacterium]|nr:hypothetical protein [Candidatus Polarisedimenticolaceae bacterium]
MKPFPRTGAKQTTPPIASASAIPIVLERPAACGFFLRVASPASLAA